ncbi:MAG: dephospho-CoA kinase [Legionellales bacterium]|nr:dephospho-CoA kinase [Legionellales bacterium]
MYKVGLTGGIGVGKSTVSKIFEDLGITVIEADDIASELTEPGTNYYLKIIEKFNGCVLSTGHLNKKMLRQIIFNSPEKKTWLENLLHPQITKELLLRAKTATSPYCILVIPLLIETNLQNLFDRILVVTTKKHLQEKRTMSRDSLDKKNFESIKKNQSSQEKLIEYANDVIENNNDKKYLVTQINHLHKKYLSLSKK